MYESHSTENTVGSKTVQPPSVVRNGRYRRQLA
jgi:hypothetical protein